MRIAVITSTFPRYRGDGTGSFIYSIMRSLTELGHEVTVLAPHDPAAVPNWQSEVTVRRVRFIWPESWSVLGHAQSLDSDIQLKWHAYPLVVLFCVFSILQLRTHVQRQDADVIHAQWLLPSGLVGAVVSRLTGVPLVVSVHGSDVFVAERYRLFQPIVRFILTTAGHVIACSRDLACRVTELGMPPAQVTAIPYGVDVNRYAPDRPQVECSRDALSVTPGRHVVMVMGRLVHKKGFAYFLRAAAQVLAECPETEFVVAGEGDLRTELEQLATSLGIERCVIFTGHIPWDQTPVYLARADVVVVPSIPDAAGNVDGLPNVLLESMASGCAIVASRVAGIPDVIRDGENGLLVPPMDEREMAQAICTLLQDPSLRQRLGTRARRAAVGGLSWIHTARKVAAVLEDSTRRAG